jgi:hypothetical protein
VTRRLLLALAILTVVSVWNVAAQPASGSGAQSTTMAETLDSRLWLTAGTAFAVARGDCQTCEEDFPYRRNPSVLVNAGYRVNRRMDVGAEVFWMPTETASGRARTTHIDAIAQFRPWVSQGFFLKGGAGMAFLRNWVDAIGPGPLNQKALSVIIGGGWAFRPDRRVGYQVFAAQHVAALGDTQTTTATIEDVVANYWSFGVSIVIR